MKKKLHDQLSMLGSNSRRWTVLKFIKNVNLSFGHLQLTLIVVLLNSFFASTQCTTPPAPSASGVTVDCGTPAIFTASGTPTGGSYVWYSNAAGTNQVGTGSTFTTPALNANTTYYVASSVSGGTPSCNTNTLANILSGLNTNQSTISSTVTNGYNFTMDAGVNSNYISDGGNDMYDAGNYISTNFTTNIPYSDGVIASSGAFGTGSSYFTSKINNMWVLTANLNNVSTFTTNGNNGADGGGLVNGTSLSITVGCQQYTLFLKRIWNASDPSINQMVIIPTTSGVNHTWSTNTNDGFHQITGLNSVTRMYYLLYASAGGSYLDDNTAINIATTFLTQVSATISVPNVCLSSLTPVTANVNQASNPSVTGATVTCGQSTSLSATGAPSGGNYVWYSDAGGTNQVGTGSSFTTPNLNSSTTYYVASTSGPGTSGSQVFNFTGNVQTFTAPVTGTYTLDVYGASGGNVTSYYPTSGGLGGRAQGSVSLTAGQTINIYVGGQGADRLGDHPYGDCTLTPGGWNGGGANRSKGNGTPGGGASDIRIGGQGLANRVIVAGGGGGCGWSYAAGGAGGGLTGGAGTNHGSGGATQAAGGAVGSSGASCVKSAGTLGQGGDGSGYSAGGGGGGGGYYGGGGGGYDQGGGGGSSYIGGVTNGTTTAGVRNGNGQVTLSWTSSSSCASSLVPVTVTVNGPTAPTVSGTTQLCGSGTTTLTATGSGNTIEWYADAAGTQLISTGSSLVTPVLNSNTTYYVRENSTISGSQTFNFSGAVQTWTVPSNVFSINVQAWGAQGGTYIGVGGKGGLAQGTVAVTPGQTINIYVGGQGSSVPTSGTQVAGGWNGGGFTYNYSTTYATSGGGASDIRIGGTALSNRILVAGGGGGGAYFSGASNGGAGGGTNGTQGAAAPGYSHYTGGGGGTQSAGGTQGGSSSYSQAGSLGQGGNSTGSSGGWNGCGGGGGYYGGGSGGALGAGGGGGSSFIGGVTNGSTTADVRSGNGQVIISWSTPACASPLVPVTVTINAAPTVTATASSISPCVGQSVTLTAGGATSYSWSNGVNTSAQTLIPNATATYTVTGTTGSCSGTAQVTVTLPTTGSSLSGNSEDATCTVNQNGWVHFYHSSGRLIGSINSQGQNLGNVTMTSYVDATNALIPACTNPSSSTSTSVLQRHWVITPTTQPSSPVLVRLPHTLTEFNSLSSAASTNPNSNDDILSPQDLDLTKYSNGSAANVNNSALDNCGVGTSTFHQQTQYGNTNTYSAVQDKFAEFSISSFSEFWLHGSATSSPLPVELISFQANCVGDGKVEVTWATASEHNSADFTVEKSRDGINWSVLAYLAGAGNSTQVINYSVADNTAAEGTNYYRLTQTDFDGASETFNIASANCAESDVLNTINVYPNPSAGDFYIDFTSVDFLGASAITITDARGSEIYTQSVMVEKGSNVFHIDNMEAVPGIYYIKVSNGTATSNVVKHSLR